MTTRRQRASDRDDRLREAEDAKDRVSQQGKRVESQLNLVERLKEGWRRVHETNHLAQIFGDKGLG